MSTVNTVDLETADLSKLTQSAGVGIVANGIAAPVLQGTYALQMNRQGAAANAYIGATATTYFSLATAFYRFYFLFTNHSADTGLCNFEDNTGTPGANSGYKCALHLDATGRLVFYDGNSPSVAVKTGPTVLQPNTLYMIQAQIGTSASAGAAVAWAVQLNGAPEMSGSNYLGTANNGVLELGGNQPYGSTSAPEIFYFDSIAVDNAAYPPAIAAAGVPQGSQGLQLNGVPLASQQSLDINGKTTWTVPAPKNGDLLHATFTATPAVFAGSTADHTLQVTTAGAVPTSTVPAGTNAPYPGSPTVLVTVTNTAPSATIAPTGNVTLTATNSSNIQVASLSGTLVPGSGGISTVTISLPASLPVGNYNLSASYPGGTSGSTTFNSSGSSGSVQVTGAPTTETVSATGTQLGGPPATVTVAVASVNPAAGKPTGPVSVRVTNSTTGTDITGSPFTGTLA